MRSIKNFCFEYTTLSIQKRLLSLILIIAFVFFLISTRLFYLQAINDDKLQLKAIDQWVRTLPLTAKRGEIRDNCGNILAYSNTSYNLYVRAKEVDRPVELAEYLSKKLSLNFDNVYEKVKNIYSSEVLIKLQIDDKFALEILNAGYKGVYLTENIKRNYPYNELLSQVIGFLTSDSIGQTGIESYYNNILCGTNGKCLTQSDVRGITLDDSLDYYVEAIDGLNLKLCVDINIQRIVENVITHLVSDHHPKGVSAIVMDPMTSKIISLAIYPSVDLNNIDRSDAKSLMSKIKNTTVTDVYEPGSTFKILPLTAALSEGLTTLDEKFYCPGYRVVDGERIKCWKTIGHGSQTLVECVQNSCNCCFMDLALRLGKEKLYKYLKAFGIGSATQVDISGESSGIILDINRVQNCDLARIGFGQTIAVTQLQLLNSFCSVINGGYLHQPSIVDSYVDKNENTVYKNTNLILNKTTNEDISSHIRFLLEKSLSKTGDMTFVENYKIGGKTGTAQKYGSDGKIATGKYISSFFGFLNCDNKPSYALLLCVDEPSSGMYYGSVVAKPYAKEIFQEIIKYKNIKQDAENIQIENIVVPQLAGMSLSKAIIALNEIGVDFEIDGEGEIVVSQFPSANTSMQKSSSMIIKTN